MKRMAVGLLWCFSVWTLTLSSTVTHTHQEDSVLDHFWTHRNLSSVPLDLDLDLQALDLSDNVIERLDVLDLRVLEKLDLSYNQLNFIQREAFKKLLHLHHLNLAKNFLNTNVLHNSRAFQNLLELKYLDISRNNLNSDAVRLYLLQVVSLEELNVNGNSLIKLSPQLFKNNKNLVRIDIENNNIVEIEAGTFERLKKLSILNLARNNLVNICNFNLYQLTNLNLSRNSLKFFLTDQNEQIFNLEILDLSFNNLLYFPVVPKRNNLKYLHLQNNKLGALGLKTSISEAQMLQKSLAEYQNTANHINNNNNINLMILQYIDLSFNHFTDFDFTSLTQMFSLKTLNLSYNCLHNMLTHINQSDFTNNLLPSLNHINLRNNQIQYLPKNIFKVFPNLETLLLQHNRVKLCGDANMINCTSFSDLKSLQHLNLAENQIKIITTNTFTNTKLTSLNLAGNKDLILKRNSLKTLQDSLESLSIANANANSSHVDTPCLIKLRFLNISHNRFKNLPPSFICSPLKVLDVQNNSFTSLSFLATWFRELALVYISNNMYNCCDTTWLTFLQDKDVNIADLDQTECQYNSSDVITSHVLQNHTVNCKKEASRTANNHVWVLILILMILISAAVVMLIKKTYNKGMFRYLHF